MPKVTLEFKLPEENHEHHVAINGTKFYLALYDMQTQLRSARKYNSFNSEVITNEQSEIIEKVEDFFHSVLDDYNIDLFEE